jgi:hypothetical protein
VRRAEGKERSEENKTETRKRLSIARFVELMEEPVGQPLDKKIFLRGYGWHPPFPYSRFLSTDFLRWRY